MFIIFDLDGTLANIEHRLHHIARTDADGNKRKPDWDAFHQACISDAPINPLIQTFQALVNAGHDVEVWSGRSDSVRTETEDWLQAHGMIPLYLRMRPAGDFTPDHELKESWLFKVREEGDWPDLVFDDRSRLVKMWRRHGIRTCQVAPGDF